MHTAVSKFDRVQLQHQWLNDLLEPAIEGGVHITNILARGRHAEQEVIDNTSEAPEVSAELGSPTHLLIGSNGQTLGEKSLLKIKNGELILEAGNKLTDWANQTCVIIENDARPNEYKLAGLLDGVMLNGRAADSKKLNAGDELIINGLSATLIRVL